MDRVPIKSKDQRRLKHSFSEGYYRNKFAGKQGELFDHIQRNPSDEEAKQKLKFIGEVLKKGDESKKMGKDFNWPNVYSNWQKQNSINDFDINELLKNSK